MFTHSHKFIGGGVVLCTRKTGQTSLLSDSYNYAGCVDYLVVKTSTGEEKYSVKKTYDDEGFCITREPVKQ